MKERSEPEAQSCVKYFLRQHDLNKLWCFVNQFIIYKIDEHNYIRSAFNISIWHCQRKSLCSSAKKWQL